MGSLHTILLLTLVASAASLEAPRKVITLTPQAAPLRHEVEKHTGITDALCEKMTSVEKCALVPQCIWCESTSGDANVQPLCLPANAAFAATYTCQSAVEAVKQELKDELTGTVHQLAPLFDPCMAYKDEGACHTNATCTWCTAGAIPSECLSQDLAKMLPSAVFKCDAQELDAPIRPGAQECFAHQADEAACGTNPACAFCKSKLSEHLPDTCLPSELSKLLPGALYDCPKEAVTGPLQCLHYNGPAGSTDQQACEADGECTFCKATQDGIPDICSPAIPQIVQYLNQSGYLNCEA